MKNQYIVFETNDKDSEMKSLEILFNRVSRVSRILFDDKPTLLPFKINFPILDENEHSVFLNTCTKHSQFDDLDERYKDSVYLAEKVNFYNLMFLDYMKDKNITKEIFQSKNPKTKLDILYDFLFSNRMDIGILE